MLTSACAVQTDGIRERIAHPSKTLLQKPWYAKYVRHVSETGAFSLIFRIFITARTCALIVMFTFASSLRRQVRACPPPRLPSRTPPLHQSPRIHLDGRRYRPLDTFLFRRLRPLRDLHLLNSRRHPPRVPRHCRLFTHLRTHHPHILGDQLARLGTTDTDRRVAQGGDMVPAWTAAVPAWMERAAGADAYASRARC